MYANVKLSEVDQPNLEFGSPGQYFDPKNGLINAGPFDLRFGNGRKSSIYVGIIGTQDLINKSVNWLTRISKEISPSLAQPYNLIFPGFKAIFHSDIVTNEQWHQVIKENELFGNLNDKDSYSRFQNIVNMYESKISQIAELNNKPDIILCCIPDEIIKACWSVTKILSKEERRLIADIKKQKQTKQIFLFQENIEETEEDLMVRDLRRALKAKAIIHQVPIQICTSNLLIDSAKNQDASTRAWNFSVATYYKSGGIPWRLKSDGPETCFVGISFNHMKTSFRHIVRSSIAQAFSNKGDGFAIKGENVPYDTKQGKQVHLTSQQAFNLGKTIIDTYKEHTGVLPMRIVLHKTSIFNMGEEEGFRAAFTNIPIIEFVNLMPTPVRLLRIGNYPPKRGTLMQLADKNYFFTTGFIPELKTYPGPHIPSPVRVITSNNTDIYTTCQEILGLSRMNWNTASISSGQPVTFFFSRNIGGIISELRDDETIPTSFKYFM